MVERDIVERWLRGAVWSENENRVEEVLKEHNNMVKHVTKYDYTKIPYGWLRIKKVVFNAPATIVFWEDGTKTVVKCSENEVYDPEKGLMAAITKKALGNQGNYYNEIKKWLPKDEETKPE